MKPQNILHPSDVQLSLQITVSGRDLAALIDVLAGKVAVLFTQEKVNQKQRTNPSQQSASLTVSLKEAADLLGVSYASVYKLVQRGLLRSCGALRHKRIPKWEIERFLKESLR